MESIEVEPPIQSQSSVYYGPKTEPMYSSCPEGKKDWFYLLFGYCFRKKYIQQCEWTYYYKVLWFKYTMDGNKCVGLYDDPNDYDYHYENEAYGADCYTLTPICLNLCCCNFYLCELCPDKSRFFFCDICYGVCYDKICNRCCDKACIYCVDNC